MTDRWRSSSAVVRRRFSLSVTYLTISPSGYRWSGWRLASATLGGNVCCLSATFLFFFLLLFLLFFLPYEVSFKCVITLHWLTMIGLTTRLQVSSNLGGVFVLPVFAFPFQCAEKESACGGWLGWIDGSNCSACQWLCSRRQNSFTTQSRYSFLRTIWTSTMIIRCLRSHDRLRLAIIKVPQVVVYATIIRLPKG